MSLVELISKLQYLATFVDNPEDVQVLIYSDFHEQTDNIKRVNFDDFVDDALYIVI